MLNRQLPPLPWEAEISNEGMMEAYALSYLARYNTEGINTRTAMSFSRSYHPTQLFVRARTPGGHPAYTIAIWNDGNLKRITVALEGTTTLGQLWSRVTGNAAARPSFSDGYVMGFFNEYSEAIYTELMADAQFRSVFDDYACNMTFAGISLGAGTAEVLAMKFRTLHPMRQTKLVKFMSPRVGDVHWVAQLYRLSDHIDFYLLGDRIDLIPHTTLNAVGSLANIWSLRNVNYCANTPSMRVDLAGLPFGDGLPNTFLESNITIADSLLPLNSANRWFNHDVDRHRYALCSIAARAPDVLGARFIELEFNDDNSWGERFRSNILTPAACKGIFDPPPADFELPSAPSQPGPHGEDQQIEELVIQAAAAPVPAQPLVIQGLPSAIAPVERPRGGWIPRRTRDLRSGTP